MTLFRMLIAAALTACAAFAQAADWQICDLKVQVREKQSGGRALQTRVLEAKASGDAACPQPGTALSFRPETADYQSELPRRQWPSPGAAVTERYRYLDGQCKNRGACRIEHYSPMPH